MTTSEGGKTDPTVLRPGGQQDPSTGLHEWYEETPELLVARKIRQLREARNWSQERLGKLLEGYGLGMRQTTVAKLESAGRPIRFNEVVALAEIFDVDYSSFYEQTVQVPTAEQREELSTDIEAARVEWDSATAELRGLEVELMKAQQAREVVADRARRARTALVALEERLRSWDERREEA